MGDAARILLVDDDEAVRRTISRALTLAGYLVDTAARGQEAIEKSNANFYNLTIIDIRLPDMEGTRLLTEMKETTPKMIKIVLTGYAALQNAIEAINKGADGYITKPVDMEELIATIREQLDKQSKARRQDEEKVKDFIETRLKDIRER